MGKVIIWGLKSDYHSHKFIQSAFHKNFLRMGFDSLWVNDRANNAHIIQAGDIVFAVDAAAKNLPIVKGANYVLHNMSPEAMQLEENHLVIQVHTSSCSGTNVGIPYVSWDAANRTLFQPWGVPTPPQTWRSPKRNRSANEYWVGSVWNNELNQGNTHFIEEYVKALGQQNISFFAKGTPTRIHPNGISESRSISYVQNSAVGAAVVGEWQKNNEYIPCRLFKNVASGALPSSNADFSVLFGTEGGIFDPDPNLLIQKVLALEYSEKCRLVQEAQQRILPYTYMAGITRILTFLMNR